MPEDVKVAFVMRIASIPGQMPLKVRKVLQMLRFVHSFGIVLPYFVYANCSFPISLNVSYQSYPCRLTEHNNAVICKISDQFIEQIKLVEPYVTWGYPSLRSVHDLIFKYGETLIR